MSKEEYQICELQYKEEPFGRMSPDNLKSHCTGLMIKISIITGWIIPEQKEVKNVLYDQFAKKLSEEYYSLNVQEVEFAIRNYGTAIQDWGKSINLSLIDSAIHPYLSKRAEIRKLEESAIKPIELPTIPGPLDYELMIEDAKKVFFQTKLVGLIPHELYEILEEKKEIDLTLEEKKAIRAKIEVRLENEALTSGLKAIKEFKALKQNKQDYEKKVKNECKRQAVAEYFIKQKMIDDF